MAAPDYIYTYAICTWIKLFLLAEIFTLHFPLVFIQGQEFGGKNFLIHIGRPLPFSLCHSLIFLLSFIRSLHLIKM